MKDWSSMLLTFAPGQLQPSPSASAAAPMTMIARTSRAESSFFIRDFPPFFVVDGNCLTHLYYNRKITGCIALKIDLRQKIS